MKKILFVLAILLCGVSFCEAQDARQVLDKCAEKLCNKDGVKASFKMESANYGALSGTISVKGRKFCATTPMATMWFDGKTQWTYLKKNDEVNVITPTEAQLQAINPYNFINLYKKGFKYTMTTTASLYSVHLTSTEASQKIKELFITIDKKDYAPTEVKLLQGTKWTTFTISNLQNATLSEDTFRFNPKDFPSAEVIDLR